MGSTSKQQTISVVLLHSPMTNREGQLITTSVTNIDLHDIARSCRTYDVDHYFVVHPFQAQHDLLQRILGHWKKGKNLEWHPDRSEAFSRLQLIFQFDDIFQQISETATRDDFEVIMPDARKLEVPQVSYEAIRSKWQQKPNDRPHKILVFGTGWGVAPEFFSKVDVFSEPILGPSGPEGYNHLSVRSAVAIILDRLLRP